MSLKSKLTSAWKIPDCWCYASMQQQSFSWILFLSALVRGLRSNDGSDSQLVNQNLSRHVEFKEQCELGELLALLLLYKRVHRKTSHMKLCHKISERWQVKCTEPKDTNN